MADLRRWKRRIRARRATVIVVTVVLVGGGAAVAWAATRPASTAYRTALAGPASVTDSLAAIGTLQPVSQATVAFPMAGQVASVGVQVGSSVAAGQTLAVLNTTGLATTVSSDQSSVATAQAKLAADQTSQTTVPASQTTTPSATTGSSSRSGSSSSSKLTTLLQGLAADQNAVRKAQQQVDADLVLVTAVDKQLAATCPAVVQSLTGAQSKPTDPPATSDTTTVPPPTTTTPPPVDVTGCTDLIDQASADEAKTATDERGLSSSVATLSTALNQVVAAVGQTASTPAPSTPSAPSGGSSTGRSGTSGSSGPASANQIAADQASVDAANAQLAAAQQNLAAATLVSPIAGTVADVTMTAGQNASANSTTAHIMVVGPGEDEVMTAVNDTSVGQVKPGQPAMITPDGVTKPIAGKVTSIGALGSTTSGGSASYPVTITLDPTSQPLFNGATASVAITLGTAQAPVTVPTSAVQTLGPFSIVSKMVNGKPTTTRVTLGVVGATVTQITSGLKAGDEVMLANITEPMPTSGNTNARAFVGGGGRAAFAGGGGGGGGGFTGGGGGGGGGGAAGAAGAGKGAPTGGG
ncbi:MAG TPA: HlyD family efflux transporter periplasmic adaptor subunit [Pseudonocardiaceae bacterium]